MSDTVISVENLSKAYRLGQIGTGTLSSDLKVWWAKVRGKPNPMLKVTKSYLNNRDGETIWALKDMSFTVGQGEALGIIGRNGAGKSTLLKVLSEVTAPTRGEVKIKGRIASLLEVGTGFHPDLTGRENTYLNGAILGMSREEVRRKFDEIVDFSGIEQFIDTPVKRYSSGMYVRLGFAVAAHLDPDILIVDEVLAVGDAEFQEKCLGKMGDVARGGRTVLFVSHRMAAITSLCQNAYWIDAGQIKMTGNSSEVVEAYLQTTNTQTSISLDERSDRKGSKKARITALSVKSAISQSNIVSCGDPLQVQIQYEAATDLIDAHFVLIVHDHSGPVLFRLDSLFGSGLPAKIPATGIILCKTDPINLSPGLCFADVSVYIDGILADRVTSAVTFNVETSDYFGTGKVFDRKHALFLLKHTWQLQAEGTDSGNPNYFSP
jgi:lipopolysaccharide transport system ATP-binding protein